VELTATIQRRITRSTFLLVGLRRSDQPISANDSNGILRTGSVYGSRGGRTAQLTIGALDDTRDNLYAPRRGRFMQASISKADGVLGSNFDFLRTRIDLREYVPVKGQHVLAFHALVLGTGGQPSFDQLPLIGGSDIMRGYARGRYRDRSLAAGQAEFRMAPVHRVGAAVFAGAGTVAASFAQLVHGRVLPTYGAGLRWQLDPRQRTAVRLDFGRGAAGASGLYVAFNEAF
jgi:outer membrane protein assembly factor BamA